MIKTILGKKLGMTSLYVEDGQSFPVSVLQVESCKVVQIKTDSVDGYDAVCIGNGSRKKEKCKKPQLGLFEKVGCEPLRKLIEVEADNIADIKVGDDFTVEMFENIQSVNVSAVSKGKGFAGTIKRHNFQRGPEGHGSKNVRLTGSIGQSASPARVIPGKKMAGQMGNKNVTVKNLKIVSIDKEKQLLVVKGAVPGANKGVVTISIAE